MMFQIYRNSFLVAGERNMLRQITVRYCNDDIKKAKLRIQKESEVPVYEKNYNAFKKDLVRFSRGEFKPPEPKIPEHVEIAIIGGGIIGSAIAHSLKQRAPDSFDLMVIERDPMYTRSSSALSVGGIRQQFSLEENVQLSMYSAEFLRNIKKHLSVLDDDPPNIQFQPHGYLFLATEEGVEQMLENHKIQRNVGAKVELLNSRQLKEKFPWLNTEGIAMGSFGVENEGWFDPWALLMAFKKKACSLGTKYVNGEVIGFEMEMPKSSPLLPDPSYTSNFLYVKDEEGETHMVEFSKLVIAGGPYSSDIARMLKIGTGPGMLKIPFPVEPRKRYVYCYHCENGPGIDLPLVVDPTGAYVRREGLGGAYVAGRSPPESEEPDISNLEVDYNFFDDSVWPIIANRIPAFECIKMLSAWAGYYDYNTLDQNALIGRHPYFSNVFFATGFSGHGIQMAPGVGRAMMELLLDKEYTTIDMSRFGLDRILENAPLYEKNIV